MTVETFDFESNLLQVLLWQYNEAANIQSLLEKKQEWTDQNVTQFINDWYDNVYNLNTTNEFGLQVWAIILGVKFDLATVTITQAFGFDHNGTFDTSTFAPENGTSLTIEQRRTILKFRYLYLTTNATIDKIDSAVKAILGNTAMVYDNLDMTLTVAMANYPDFYTKFILDNYNVIPRPAGVELKYALGYSRWFGFDGSLGNNFDNSNFGA